ncbi:MAG: ribosome biogenesis GTP-binding protein YihA/YsxC [Gemmatimonadaceae bacterium]
MIHSAGEVDPLPIRQIDYLGPMETVGGWRPDLTLPEIAFAGRSNVGKSALINALVRRRKLARVSNTPGRTRAIHFFQVNDFVLADLPGYGYARVSRERREEWRPLIEDYLTTSPRLAGVVLLLDVRREPSDDDLQMLDFLAGREAPTLIAVTKTDKVSRRELPIRLGAIAQAGGVSEDQLVPFSIVSGVGRQELAAAVVELVTTAKAL